nr:hypothetical protein GCM10020093_002900 [Planobispora longispora]
MSGSWDVRQRHETADPEAVLADLENGVTSLWLALAPEDLPRALDRVHLELVSVTLEAGERTREAAESLFALAARKAGSAEAASAALTGTLGADPSPTTPAPALPPRLPLRGVGTEPRPGPRAVTGTAGSRSRWIWPAGAWRSSPGSGRWSWTRRRTTTRAGATPRSWAARSRPASPTCGR